MTPEDARQLLDYLEWADATMWRQVLATPAATTDSRVRELLVHSHTVEWVYLQVWWGEVPRPSEADSFPDLAALVRWVRQYHRERARFVAMLTAELLAEQVRFPWQDRLAERFGEVHPASIAQAIIQVVMHSAHHRGQINTRLRELGGEPPLTDFIAWAWTGRPPAQWPAL